LGDLSKKFSVKAPMLSAPSIAAIREDSSADEETPSVRSLAATRSAKPGAGEAVGTAATAVDPQHAQLFESDTSTAKGILFYLGVVGADGLPSGVEITCAVKFNSFVVHTMHAVSTQDNYMSAKVAFYCPAISLRVPPGLPLAACELQVLLMRQDAHHHTVPLAEVTIRGSLLVAFLRKGSQWVEAKRHAPALPHGGGFGATLGAAGMHLLSHGAHADAPAAGQGTKPCRLQLIASYQPIRQEQYELKVLGAKNLPKADVFGSRYESVILNLLVKISVVGAVCGTNVLRASVRHFLTCFCFFPIVIPS
jgi:hypothetical protein